MSSKRRAGLTLCIARAVAFVVLAASLVGCGTADQRIDVPPAQMQAYLADKPPALRPQFRKVLTGGERNSVLNFLEAGLGAMDMGRWSLAERTFDQALLRIEAIFGTNERARQARSLWYKEDRKDFKGEPYERVMAYYYRGLLYLRRGDFQNARACFMSGALQDAFAEEENNRCDFALLIFLQGWASQCDGDRRLARDAYREVKRLRPDFVAPDWDDNVLVVAETGTSPRKVSDGPGHYQLKFRRGRGFTESRVRLSLGGRTVRAYPIEDIAWQAMTRGGRPVDKIIKGKVTYRRTGREVGVALTDVSSKLMMIAPVFKNTRELQGVAVALGLVGLASHIVSTQIQTQADTRYWNNLPDAVHVYTCRLPPGGQSVRATFYTRSGRLVGGLSRSGSVHFPDSKHGLAWLRSRRAVK